MRLNFFGRRRAVGLDVGHGSVKVIVLEGRPASLAIAGQGFSRIDGETQGRQLGQAIHAALAQAEAGGEPVIAAVGGADIVIRQVALPPLPPTRILPALEIQYRDLGLLPPGEATMDAQLLRRSKDGISNEVLSVSVPQAMIEERVRLFQQAAVTVRVLDVEPLALLNAGLHLTGLEAGELLVLLTIGRRGSVLCLYSEQGPVVARYLDVGAEAFTEAVRLAFGVSPFSVEPYLRSLPVSEVGRVEAKCSDLIERVAEDVRLSLTFYRTEYDRESLPRYAVGGWLDLPYLGRWVADRLGLGAPFEVMDPFRAAELAAPPGAPDGPAGPQFLQAFGLALRGL